MQFRQNNYRKVGFEAFNLKRGTFPRKPFREGVTSFFYTTDMSVNHGAGGPTS